MKKGYWVVTYRSVSDADALKRYAELASKALAVHGGTPIVRSSEGIVAFESGLTQRTVVIEFESFEKALATHNSEEYALALAEIKGAAERDFRVVEGV